MKKALILIIFSFLNKNTFAKRTYTLEKIKREMYCGKENNKALQREPLNLKEMGIIIPKVDEMFPPEVRKKLKNKIVNQQQDFSKIGVRDFVDLSEFDTPVKKQWGGTCTTFGLIALVENIIRKPETINLSENHLWYSYQEYNVDTAINTFNSKKVTTEEYWPQTNRYPYEGYLSKAKTKILSYHYIGNNIARALKAINNGRPVYIGMTTSQGMYRGDAVIDPCTGGTSGGHAFSLVGYKIDKEIEGGGYFILKNSWGTRNGDNGYQYMPFNHCTRRDFYCYMYDVEEILAEKNQTPAPVPPEDLDFPHGFNIDQVQLSTRLYKPWYSSKNRLKIKVLLSEAQQKYVKWITYSWVEDGVQKEIITAKGSKDYYEKIKLKENSYQFSIKIHFVNDFEYEIKKDIQRENS